MPKETTLDAVFPEGTTAVVSTRTKVSGEDPVQIPTTVTVDFTGATVQQAIDKLVASSSVKVDCQRRWRSAGKIPDEYTYMMKDVGTRIAFGGKSRLSHLKDMLADAKDDVERKIFQSLIDKETARK